MTPPFRVEHIGSFLRPAYLLEAARRAKAGGLAPDEYRRVQDRAITEIVRWQEAAGLRSITDGEFRRRLWSAGFFDAVSGFAMREDGGLRSLGFRSADASVGVPASPYAREKLRRTRPIVADDLRFLQTVVQSGVPKVTLASPPVMHYFLGPRAVDPARVSGHRGVLRGPRPDLPGGARRAGGRGLPLRAARRHRPAL